MPSLRNSSNHLKKKLSLILQKLLQQIKEEETLPNLFYEIRITLLAKSERERFTRKQIYRPRVTHLYRCKIHQRGVRKLGNTDKG